jgi:hypothetical protein
VASVTYAESYELEQARVYAGISIAEFDALPGTPEWMQSGERSKAHILVLYRMSNAIPAAVSDAQSREMERKSKRGGRY